MSFWLSSIMKWGYQGKFKLVYLFIYFTKIFWGYKKHQNSKQTILTLWEVFMRVKTVAFVVFCSLILVFVGWFCLICVFLCSKSFRKKKIKRLKIVPITSFTILLKCTPTPQPAYREFICTHLFLFLWIFDHLRKSFWISSYL